MIPDSDKSPDERTRSTDWQVLLRKHETWEKTQHAEYVISQYSNDMDRFTSCSVLTGIICACDRVCIDIVLPISLIALSESNTKHLPCLWKIIDASHGYRRRPLPMTRVPVTSRRREGEMTGHQVSNGFAFDKGGHKWQIGHICDTTPVRVFTPRGHGDSECWTPSCALHRLSTDTHCCRYSHSTPLQFSSVESNRERGGCVVEGNFLCFSQSVVYISNGLINKCVTFHRFGSM